MNPGTDSDGMPGRIAARLQGTVPGRIRSCLPDTLRGRLSLWSACLIVIFGIATGAYAFYAAFDEALERQDETLHQLAWLVANGRLQLADQRTPAAAPIHTHSSTAASSSAPPPGTASPSTIHQILPQDLEARLVLRMLPDDHSATTTELASLPADTPPGLHTIELDSNSWRIYVSRPVGTRHRVAVGQPTEERDEAAWDAAIRTLVPWLVLLPLLVLVLRDLIARLLAPVDNLATNLDQRPPDDLTALDASTLPGEIRPFASALNRLLQRVDDSNARQRRFVADAAHELRTPLTALRLQAERLLAYRSLPDEARARANTLLNGIVRGQSMVNQLLSLARANESNAGRQPRVLLQVRHCLRQVLEELAPLAHTGQIDLGVVRCDPVSLQVDEQDLATILRNLLSNALRHTPAGGRVDVELVHTAQAITLSVSDSGPGIAPNARERVFEPFHREPGQHTQGSGLGLSIVRALVQKLGGTVALETSDANTGTGLRVVVSLPATLGTPTTLARCGAQGTRG